MSDRKRTKRLAVLRPYHIECMQLKLQGWTYKEIGAKFDKTESTIKSWFSDDELFYNTFQEIQNEIKENNLNKIKDLASRAVNTMEDLLVDQDSRIKLSAAKDILDRAGYKPTDKSEVKLDGEITTKHSIDENLLKDDEFADLLKKMKEKLGDDS